MSDCEFTQYDVCQNLKNNVVKTEVKNGETTLTTLTIKGNDSRTYDLLSRDPSKDRYLTTEKTRYNFNTDAQIISALIEILKDQNNLVLHIYDSDLDQNYEYKRTTYEAESNDTKQFYIQPLNKDFFIKITDVLEAYCKLPRFNKETFQKAIKGVDVLYPSIKLYSIVFPSGFCPFMGGRKSRKSRRSRKTKKVKRRRTRRTKRRRSRK